MSHVSGVLSRRALLGAGLVLPLAPRLAMAQPRGLAFAVFRNDAKIGEHHVAFAGEADALTATTEAEMVVRLGPVPIFKYRHHAIETVRGGAFASLETHTTSNGKLEHVTAEKTAGGGVDVDGPAGRLMLAANVSPLNHWNLRSFPGPFFNPETGKQMKLTVSRAGPNRWALRGEVEMDDVYDEAGQWLAAKARGSDGSAVEYRRL
jgi:hypothetical protein